MKAEDIAVLDAQHAAFRKTDAGERLPDALNCQIAQCYNDIGAGDVDSNLIGSPANSSETPFAINGNRLYNAKGECTVLAGIETADFAPASVSRSARLKVRHGSVRLHD